MTSTSTITAPLRWNYPAELPVVEHREEIITAIRTHPVVVVVSDTGSGKTTQLPKMVAEALGPEFKGRIGCTQVTVTQPMRLFLSMSGWIFSKSFVQTTSPSAS